MSIATSSAEPTERCTPRAQAGENTKTKTKTKTRAKKSKHAPLIGGLTPFELQVRREMERREKARLRMARLRAELKTRSPEEQESHAARNRVYQARHREKQVFSFFRHREDLRIWEAQRRVAVYKAKYGPEAYLEYARAKRERRRRARAQREAKLGGYFRNEEEQRMAAADGRDAQRAPVIE
ncbi:hypothetical protein DFH07DRAFT_947984 [Mycena maculata]|uniref:Uncharacterized protein n=1 Tax=Mycena maculata TaxID=230809 RepID=A0AAD7KHN9_9AGAR|nr:hypothetical protein DFH07DRAFT_947984 [Mycena maculata]